MPPKRKQAEGRKSASAKKKQDDDDVSPLATLLTNLQQLSQDKSRCTALLQAFTDDKSDDNVDCSWIVASTKIIEVMVQHETCPEVAIVLAHLCHALATCLYKDKSKLERSAQNGGTEVGKCVKSILGRAIMSITIGSTVALQCLPESKRALWAATIALDICVNHAMIKNVAAGDGWHHALQSLLDDASSGMDDELEEACIAADCVLKLSTEIQECIATLNGGGTTATPETPTGKRRRAKKESTLSTQYPSLLNLAQEVILDGRVSIRRWASMTFVWFCQGQAKLLEVVCSLLSQASCSTLDCPARIGRKKAPSPKKKSSTATTLPTHVPGNVAIVALASRLMNIVSCTNSNCGNRAPTGGMDTYAVQILASSSKTWPRAEYLQVATVAIYKLVQAHASCLETNISQDLLVNDETQGFAAAVPEGATRPLEAQFFPSVHKTVQTLCQASTSPAKLSVISAAFLLSSPAIKDAKCCNFAMTQLSDRLDRIVTGSFSSGESMETDDAQARLIQQYRLDQPLPVPEVPALPDKKKKKRKSKTPAGCMFGGMFESGDAIVSDEELLSLMVRAVHDKFASHPASLFTCLIQILQSAYDLRDPPLEETRGKKRASSSKASQGKRKRKKTDKGSQVTETQDSSVEKKKMIKSTRAGLATETLNALRLCLWEINNSELLKFFRQGLITQHIIDIVDLNNKIGQALADSQALKSDDDDEESKGFFAESHSGDYRHYERQMWTAHIQLCQTLGRGKPTYDKRRLTSSSVPILGDATRRLEVFHAVAEASYEGKVSSSPPEFWPLCLSAPHQTLVASNLISEPIITESDPSPELYILQTFMTSIVEALENPSKLTHAEWFEHARALVADDDVPLGRRDAILLLLAVSRLPKKMQMDYLNRFIAAVSSKVDALRSNESHVALIRENADVSGFIGRVVTVCATMTNLVTVGSKLRDVLFQDFGPMAYPMPQLMTKEDMTPKRLLEEGLWYSPDSSFVGLFSDWQSPIVPEVSGYVNLNAIAPKTVSNLSTLNDSAMHLGFISAKRDRCFLLYSAWNASGQSAIWDKKTLRVSQWKRGTPCKVDTENVPHRLCEIRDDVYALWREISGSAGSFPGSLLTKVLSQRGEGHLSTSGTFKDRLESMMSKAEAMMDSLLSSISSQDEPEEVSMLLFATMEAVAVQVAFIVSAYTRCNDHFLASGSSTGRTRQRRSGSGGYDGLGSAHLMSDDGSAASDAGYNRQEDEKHPLMMLSDACDAFGAAPTHPDFLDSSCLLREGLTANDAVRTAERALACLSKLAAVSAAQYEKWTVQSLLTMCGDTPNGKERAALAYKLWSIGPGEIGDKEETSSEGDPGPKEQWALSIAELCGIDKKKTTELFSDEISCRNFSHVVETLFPSTSQRIFGRLHDQIDLIDDLMPSLSEYRARNEWELLLSDALLGACVDYDFPSQPEGSATSGISQSRWEQCYSQTGRWRRVQEASLGHMMPVTALLRFGRSGGQGRKRHPFADGALVDKHGADLSSIPLEFSEPLPLTTSRAQDDSVNKVLVTLATVARASAAMEDDDQFKKSNLAIAANLLINSKRFEDLEALEKLRLTFVALHGIRALVSVPGGLQDDRLSSLRSVTETLITCLEKKGALSQSEDDKELPSLALLLSLLGGNYRVSFDTVEKADVDYIAIFSSTIGEGSASAPLKDHWNWQLRNDWATADAVSMLFCDESEMTREARRRISHILGNLAKLEQTHGKCPGTAGLFPSVVSVLSEIHPSKFRSMVEWITNSPEEDTQQVADTLAMNLCTFLSVVVVEGGTGDGEQVSLFQGGQTILDSLLDTLDQWLTMKSTAAHPIMELLCLLGARYGALHTIGARLVSKVTTASTVEAENCLGPVETFFRFVQDIQTSFCGGPAVSGGTSHADASTGTSAVTSEQRQPQQTPNADSSDRGTCQEAPRACSFVQRSGFHPQHWYHCYSCSLTWDRGCCALCALRCHQGHDVAYSRFSSFFCDCGGEAGSAEGEGRTPCKCLSTIDAEEAETLFGGQDWAVVTAPKEIDATRSSHPDVVRKEKTDACKLSVRITSLTLNGHSKSSIDKLTAEAVSGSWVNQLFALLRSRLDVWDAKESVPSDVGLVSKSDLESSAESRRSHPSKPSLTGRSGKELDLQPLTGKELCPIRAAKAGTFQLAMSSDTSTDRVKRALLLKNGIRRRALVADSRGRIIVAEPCALLFCTVLPSVNVRFHGKHSEVPVTRSQMTLAGSSRVRFNIVGMELCPNNERHLAVWGTAEACIVILSKACDKVERTIELPFELEPDECEIDYVLRCTWIPGSQTILTVACGPFVKLFDLKFSEGDKANALASYSLAYEAVLRDVALVPVPTPESTGTSQTNSGKPRSLVPETVKLILLLDIGQLHAIDLRFDDAGDLVEQGDMYIESGEGIAFPITGVQFNHSNQVASEGVVTRSMGEGSSLCFLPNSNVLLYSCVGSCVVALLFDSSGNINGSFELLPNVVKSDVLGYGPDGFSITGPFTHWTELGVVEDGDSRFFRALCVGKSSRSSRQKLLCLRYNENVVQVKEIQWPTGGSVGTSLSLISSFDGIARFSAPSFRVDCAGDSLLGPCDFKERAFVSAVSSTGSLMIFGEEMGSSEQTRATEVVAPSAPSFPLTIFEKVINVSDDERLCFGGDRIGSDPASVKSKLSPKNSSYFMCPSRDGCTLSISLRSSDAGVDSLQSGLVIVAFRLLVGSTTTEFIPKFVCVEGRRVALKPDKKRWYDVPLTGEEIALSLRNGFVSLGIGPSFDPGNSPLLDAVEVYAATRKQISHWLPLNSYMSEDSLSSTTEAQTHAMEIDPVPAEENKLATTVRTLTHLLHILGTRLSISREARQTVQQLIRKTAIVDDGGEMRKSLSELVGQIEPDHESRQKLLDEETVIGVSEAIREASEMQRKALSSSNILTSSCEQLGDRALRTVLACLKTSAAIARERPDNYKSALDKMMSQGIAEVSIAISAVELFKFGKGEGLEFHGLIPHLVELCLVESLLFPSGSRTSKFRCAGFDVIEELLGSQDESQINSCCESVLSFWKSKLAGRMQSAQVSYQCDSCSLLPIEGSRYTLPEGSEPPGGDNDIDLCSACYRIGQSYADSNNYDASKVRIRGNTVADLSCASLGRMKPVAIKASVSQNLAVSDDVDMNTDGAESRFDEFSSELYTDLLQLLVKKLDEKQSGVALLTCGPLINLLLETIKTCGDADVEMRRAEQFAEAVSSCASKLTKVIHRHENLEAEARSLLIVCLRGLLKLVSAKDDSSGGRSLSNVDKYSVDDSLLAKSKGKTDPRFICEEHGVPAVRRRCSHGAHKNRRFYVCGMERDSRCCYFEWADAAGVGNNAAVASSRTKCQFTVGIERFVWELLKQSNSTQSGALHVELCSILGRDAHHDTTGLLDLPVGENEESVPSSSEKGPPVLSSVYDREAAASDYADGVFCCQEKLQLRTSQWLLEGYLGADGDSGVRFRGKDSVLQATLDLLSHTAGMLVSEETPECDVDTDGWFSLLCEIICCSKSTFYEALAKGVLKRLCGDKKVVYDSVRDHYIFGFQFRKLLEETRGPLLAARNIREQARQCGVHWRTCEKVSFKTLSAGGLVGTQDLISENCLTVEQRKKIGATLDELAKRDKVRCANWKEFCSLTGLPAGKQSAGKAADGLVASDSDDPCLQHIPPIIHLVWLACVLSGENQIKVLRLIDIATSFPDDTQPRHPLSVAKKVAQARRDNANVANPNAHGGKSFKFVPGSGRKRMPPISALLKGEKAMSAKEVYAFIVEFVVNGNNPQLREVGGKVALSFCRKVEAPDFEWLFPRLVDRALADISQLGSACSELFHLLRSLAASGIVESCSQLSAMSSKVGDAFMMHMRSLSQSPGAGSETLVFRGDAQVADGSADTERYDFSSCAHCHRTQEVSSSRDGLSESDEVIPPPTSRTSRTTTDGASSATAASAQENSAMLPDQVRPFTRERLEASTQASISTEFATYSQLKCRLAVSDIHLTVSDPRGRFVKTIVVYYTPRQVSDVNQLKSEDYSEVWQRCATMSLSRGASRVSVHLKEPIIAANLKIEYSEFYERPGGSRAADGSLLLHCPRCTRVVNNAHGVCGHCGETAMQCRRCRHINYDRLDFFLCVECGYCSTGTFSYDLTAGAASNAVAIVDDESYERSIKILRETTKLHGELRAALKERLKPASGKKSLSGAKYGPGIKRTFLGELPKIKLDKTDSAESGSGRRRPSVRRRQGGSEPSAASNRARSLIRLARQLRSDDPSRGGDLLVRQALLGSSGRAIALEEIDEVDRSDVIGIINASDLDAPDPLSRLVASIQGRVRANAERDREAGGDEGGRPSRSNAAGNNDETGGTADAPAACAEASADECKRLYQLMREAEREIFELQRRISAWKRLENDTLVAGLTNDEEAPLSPSQCSKCRGPVTLQLLMLLMELLRTDAAVESTVTPKLIRALFDEPPLLDKDLFDTKRLAIINLATKSEHASKLVLNELRIRLRASVNVSEILGKIIAVDSGLCDDFVSLATETLESGYY